MAIAARDAKSGRRIFCMSSDGDLNEGSTWEAIMFAAQEKLSNLTMIVDYNQVQALGHSRDIIDLRCLKTKLEAFSWNAVEIDGHNVEEIYEALSKDHSASNKPYAVIAHTIKCKGIPEMEDTVRSHYKYVADEKLEEVIKAIEEAAPKFKTILDAVKEADKHEHYITDEINKIYDAKEKDIMQN